MIGLHHQIETGCKNFIVRYGENILTGAFIISGLAPGDYRVGVFVDTAGSALAGEYYNDSDWDGADPVSVTAGATTPNIDFGLDAGGSISGTVTRESDGTPIAGADVCFKSLKDSRRFSEHLFWKIAG